MGQGGRRSLVTRLGVAAALLLIVDGGAVSLHRSAHPVPLPALHQSVPVAVITPPAPPTEPASHPVVVDPSTAWAVLIGVQHYDAPTHPTFGALGDVAAYHQLLINAGWSDSHILTLTDQAATGAAIRNATAWLTGHSTAGGFSLFHYSGHVLQSGGREFLWGVDNDLIPNDQFASTITAVKGRAWIDVAGCESAGFDIGLASPSRFYTSSSMVTQKSYEDPTWAESVWAGFLVDRGMLRGGAGPDPSVQAAVRWAQKQAPVYTSLQQPYGPQMPYAEGGDGEWYLGPAVAPVGTALTAPAPAAQPTPAAPASPAAVVQPDA